MSDDMRANSGEPDESGTDVFDLLAAVDRSRERLGAELLSVLGHCVAFSSNDARVVEIARERYARWTEGEPAAATSRLRVLIDATHPRQTTGRPRTPGDRVRSGAIPVVLNAPDAAGLVLPADRLSIATFHPTLLSQRQLFAEEVLDATMLALVSRFDRHPVHAATIARGAHAVILYGASGAGKSTLAWMAHSAGLSVRGDDRAWIQLQPELRLWTERARVRLHPAAMSHFPETDRARLAIDGARGDKFVTTLDAGSEPHVPITRVTPCLLARSSNHAILERLGRDEVVDALTRDIPAGFDRFPARHAEVVSHLAADGGWRLALSNDPWQALPHLRAMLDA